LGKERGIKKGVTNMSATPTTTPDSMDFFGIPFETIVIIAIVAVVALTIERIMTRYISQVANRFKWELTTTNNITLTFRIFILIGTVAAIGNVAGLPPEWILSISAIGGAALGFASQKTLGNFIAGLFLLAAHPFEVGNYVRIGAVEGIVQEISINYTKVLTGANNIVSISNLQILDREITNFAYRAELTEKAEIYCYTFEIGFDHSVPTWKIRQFFEEVFKDLLLSLPKKPSCTLIRSGAAERVYVVYLYVRKPKDIFEFRPLIAESVYDKWDTERLRGGS
jgi:small-conductance mechanosensitive channel